MNLKHIIKHPTTLTILVIAGVVVLSSIAGGVTGGIVAMRITPDSFTQQGFYIPTDSTTTSVVQSGTPQATSTAIRLVPIEVDTAATRVVPEPIFQRQSPVAVIYGHKKSGADVLLGDGDQIGKAVAVTSDGWFVTAPSVVEGWKTADLLLWQNGHAYRAEKALLDRATQLVFIKTSAKNLPSTPFADVYAAKTGLAAWLESSPNEYAPSAIVALRASTPVDPASSDKAVRRLVALGSVDESDIGSPVWDSKGSLIGIVDTFADGRLFLTPASNLAASLQSLISGTEIDHASLGVFALDRMLIRSTAADDTTPSRGAWIKEDKRTGRAIVKDSAAEKAGLKSGDVILRVDRDIMDGSSDLSDIILQYRPGSDVTLRVWRVDKEIDVPLKLGTQVTSEVIL
ncbi:MAG: S1C family serine protease [Patescibacteria group bacterium]|nr:S1C family serine protease [Patescibacteria group bacterium]